MSDPTQNRGRGAQAPAILHDGALREAARILYASVTIATPKSFDDLDARRQDYWLRIAASLIKAYELHKPTPQEGVSGQEPVAWRTMDEKPESGCKIIALYNDGSGAIMFFVHDGGYIDENGDEFANLDGCDRWTYLPHDLEFWCETWSEDPLTLNAKPSPSAHPAPLPSHAALVEALKSAREAFRTYAASAEGPFAGRYELAADLRVQAGIIDAALSLTEQPVQDAGERG